MNKKSEQFFNKLKKAVEIDQLKLPTLPEIALKIRKAVESESSSAQQIAAILTQDASMTARLLQVANSPIFRARAEIDSLQIAVTRLGTRVVRDLVITLSMKQIFKSKSTLLDKRFREIWETSVEVAVISRMLATQHSHLEPEQALIAGLIHNIGALPILQLAEEDEELSNNEQELNTVLMEIQGLVGEMTLTFWNFPQPLIDVVAKWNAFNRQHNGPADYVDVVQAALLESGKTSLVNAPDDWNKIPAFKILGVDPEINIIEQEENRIIFEETTRSLVIM
jgi:HD-like signal output (HDOD) protein